LERFLDPKYKARVTWQQPIPGMDRFRPALVDGRYTQSHKTLYGRQQEAVRWTTEAMTEKYGDVVARGFDGAGTGYRARIADEAMLIAGKSGTSQVRNITAAERARGVTGNDQLPWERRDHALFIGFAPYDAPRLAVAAIVEHGGGGSSVAGPVVRDVMLAALHDGHIPPIEAYPSGEREAARERLGALPIRPEPEPKPSRSRA
jgi:cell division protein FtsI/penicillin-binding protein 2